MVTVALCHTRESWFGQPVIFAVQKIMEIMCTDVRLLIRTNAVLRCSPG